MLPIRTVLLFPLIACCNLLHGQDSSLVNQLGPASYIKEVSRKANHLNAVLDKKTNQALKELTAMESQLATKLSKVDPQKAVALFGQSQQRMDDLKAKMKGGGMIQYLPSLDSMGSSLKFLELNPDLVAPAGDLSQKLKSALAATTSLQDQFQQAEQLSSYLKERQQYLRQQLGNLDFGRELKKLNKQVYYYSAQVNEYKELLKDKKKAERKALALLRKTQVFKNFMRKHSQLATLFRLPGGENEPDYQASLAGLQTRSQVSNLIQQQVGMGGSSGLSQVQTNVQQAQSQMNSLRDKLLKSSNEVEEQDFKPNNQKVKRFKDRLEIGTNLQSQRANGFLPASTTLGLSLGYKVNDQSIIGIGASYQLGWGRHIRHITISHQGIGTRSFVDWKIKSGFWVSGGYEMNYKAAFRDFVELQDSNHWQTSGLLGITKVVSVKSKLMKKAKVQLLWDFLSYQQAPVTQPIILRVGYVF